jgi:hypothetical protein
MPALVYRIPSASAVYGFEHRVFVPYSARFNKLHAAVVWRDQHVKLMSRGR